jgi:uncharacterized protein YjbJ (UPF0337 family)
MNWDIIQGKWAQLKGAARTEWGKLTDDEWDQLAGNKDMLVGKLQERYGWAREEAEKRADTWAESQREMAEKAP